jgi:hypothetical protein
MGHLTLREALASQQLDAFVREQQNDGAELARGSELERGLALLITQRRLFAPQGQLGAQLVAERCYEWFPPKGGERAICNCSLGPW